MPGAITWARQQWPLFAVPLDGFTHPWFIPIFIDACPGFVIFCLWMAWEEQSWAARVPWFVSIIRLGNIAMAACMLHELFSVGAREPARDYLEKVFTRRNRGGLILPGILWSYP